MIDMNTENHELSLIAADVEAYRTDCSTPVFQMVRNMKEERDQLRAERDKMRDELNESICLRSSLSETLQSQNNYVNKLRAEVERLKETHIMQLAAISVAANSNTESNLKQALKCHPDYKTVALSVVLVAAQREIWERNQKDQWRAVAEQAAKAFHNYPNVPSHQKCLDWLAAYEKQKAGK